MTASVDPDVDLPDEPRRRELAVVLAVALGGVLGAEARYGLGVAMPHADAAWPWSTLLINLIGSLLIGVLMPVVLERRPPHRLARPFLGTGVLGGFTTFSTFSVDLVHLLDAGRPFVAIGYAAASFAGCFAATAVGLTACRRVLGPAVPR